MAGKFLVLALFLCQSSCFFGGECEETIKESLVSPNGNHVAIWAVRDCGATTDYSSIVAIALQDGTSGAKDIVFVVKGDPSIRLTWQDNSLLKVNCESCAKESIFKQMGDSDGVTITY